MIESFLDVSLISPQYFLILSVLLGAAFFLTWSYIHCNKNIEVLFLKERANTSLANCIVIAILHLAFNNIQQWITVLIKRKESPASDPDDDHNLLLLLNKERIFKEENNEKIFNIYFINNNGDIAQWLQYE
ncbi:hypothetical protein [Pseudalkalibacillus caeni]|uniref:Uncharacterized protein n=1 Tax=Exobacillus caeni TaxID=2574798 RepID=A0A5R9F6Q6_9BACL|nr:hypothetical protein [Pseudalkalibacillus caeni]TLS38711.1 hypothetical protein FCL54_04210 [Pseudalkalibacillus caeni]